MGERGQNDLCEVLYGGGNDEAVCLLGDRNVRADDLKICVATS